MSHPRTTLALALLCLAPVAARADEGRIPIYGTTTITQPGAYVVTRDFAGYVWVQSNDVTIDLNGRTIATATSGIYVDPGRRRITIRNGRLSGGTNAIFHQSLTTARSVISLEDLIIEGTTGAGFWLWGMERVEIRRCTIASAGGDGMIVSGGSGAFTGAIEDNVVRAAAGNGMQINGLAAGQVRRNVVSSFGSVAGIYLQGSVASPSVQGAIVVEGNTISNGAANTSGIHVSAESPGNLVSGNTVSTCGEGITIVSSGNHVTGNVCRNNTNDGIEVPSGPANNFLLGNTCTQNGSFGIRAGGASNRYRDNMLLGNTSGAATGGGDAGGNITS